MFDKIPVRNYDNLSIIFFEQMKFELVMVEILEFGKLEFELDIQSPLMPWADVMSFYTYICTYPGS
jgi:hypothetical protein